ncbi:MAG: hypothetical protein M1827_002745 [Pycnora praestabilis]|nr:MAG: hypothetical protein M1827_002745 [Pycnora praestabilis]
MSSTTVETSREGTKQSSRDRLAYLNRDRPLFTARRAQQEFLTDSMISQSPSPSPSKNNKRKSIQTKTRWNSGGATTSRATSNAAANVADENRPPSSSSSNQKRTQYLPKPRHSQTTVRKSPRQFERQRNTSPSPRPRKPKEAKPSHAPSPPRGLKEAYDRVVAEEKLAAEEDEVRHEDLTSYTYHYTHADRSRDTDRIRVQRLRDSTSPAASEGSRRGSAQERIAAVVDDVSSGRDEIAENNTQDSGSGSAVTPISFLVDGTDDTIGRALLEHARDEERVKGVLKAGSRAFRKAKVGERVGLTMENLQRNNKQNDAGQHKQNGIAIEESISTERSDPPVHVPREWGRKGRTSKDWLSRITGPEGKFTGDRREEDAIISTAEAVASLHESVTAKVDWIAAAADVPLPSVEDSSSILGRSSQASSPSSMKRRKTSLDGIREWEIDNEFTARSIQISTSPPIKTRNTTLDRIMNQEIENLRGRGVTTSRLGEIRERSFEERLRKSTSPLAFGRPKEMGGHDDNIPALEGGEMGLPEVKNLELPKGGSNSVVFVETNGDPIPDTPIVIFKTNQKDISTLGPTIVSERPGYERQDSRDILRRLARAASASPSPTKPIEPEKSHDAQPNEKQPISLAQESSNGLAVGTSLTSRSTREEINAESKKIEAVRENRKTEEDDLPQKTPVVTGAWVETPAAVNGQRGSSPSSDLDVDEEISMLGIRDFIRGPSSSPLYQRSGGIKGRPIKDEGPVRPKSALAIIIDDAKRKAEIERPIQASDALGDSTIDSLENMMAHNAPDSPFHNAEDLQTNSNVPDAKARPLSQAGRERQQEMLAYERMDKRLRTLRSSIRDAKHGIESLENQVEFTPIDSISCPTCGCTAANGLKEDRCNRWHVRLPFVRLYEWPKGGMLRLTKFGWFTLLCWVYFLSEWTICELYCQPKYASSMRGYGVDIRRPRPWVITRSIWTLLSPFLLPFFKIFLWAIGEDYDELLDFVSYRGTMYDYDMYRRNLYSTSATASVAYTKPVWPVGSPELSMMEDEVI